MIKTFLSFSLFLAGSLFAQKTDYPIQGVPFTTAIPYYAWAHRGKGEMTVWFPTRIKEVEVFAAK